MRTDAALLALALLACSPAAPPPVQLVAGDTTLELLPDRSALVLRRGDAIRLRLPASAFLFGLVGQHEDGKSYDPYWLEQTSLSVSPGAPADLEWHASTALRVSNAAADSLDLLLDFDGGYRARLSITTDAADRFSVRFVPDLPDAGYLAWLRVQARTDATEAFYGLGGFLDDVNHRGKLRPMQIEFDETETANNEAHSPIPMLVGTTGWGLFAESRRAGLFDVARKEPDLLEVTYATGPEVEPLTFHLFTAPHPLDVTRHYYDLTGSYRLPAPWALGPILWRNENRDQTQVLSDLQTIRDLDLPTNAIWFDRPYATAVNSFDFDRTKFPGPVSMIAALHAAGLRVAAWHTPYVMPDAVPFAAEARDGGFFPPTVGLLLNKFNATPIDFTNPDAFRWWQALVRRYIDLGIEGFKLDFAEDVQIGALGARTPWLFADGSDERTMHHGYQLLYHRIYADLLPDGGFLLTRTARWGDQKNGVILWPGDLDATFTKFKEPYVERGETKTSTGVGGLPASVINGLNLGPAGFPLFGADTGGYIGSPPDNELFMRWAQQTALSTVMQVGDSSSQTPWEFNAANGRSMDTVDNYRIHARLHLRLFPYEWSHLQRLVVGGRPLQRALGLAHPELGQHPSDTYLFGDDLLVAPVLTRGQRARTTWIPAGEWVDWWDGTPYSGPAEITIPAPLEKLPLLVRAGAIIPLLRPTIDTLAPATLAGVDSFANDPGRLWARIVPGSGRFPLYDGSVLSQSTDGAALTLEFAPGTTFTEGVVFEVIRRARPAAVEATPALVEHATRAAFDAAATGWFWSPDVAGTLLVKPAAGPARVTIR